MAVPAVSHDNWERTRALSQIAMGTLKVDSNSLSFSKQLERLLESGRAFIDEIEEKKEVKQTGPVDPGKLVHQQWEDGITMEYSPGGRDRPHRPEVPDELVEELRKVVDELFPGVPADEFSANKLLGLYLDEVESAYATVNCTIQKESVNNLIPDEP
jgi:hypothetical protein